MRVIDGAFANFSGTVEEVKPEKQKLKVKVSISVGDAASSSNLARWRSGS